MRKLSAEHLFPIFHQAKAVKAERHEKETRRYKCTTTLTMLPFGECLQLNRWGFNWLPSLLFKCTFIPFKNSHTSTMLHRVL